jgi:hypothetical protein
MICPTVGLALLLNNDAAELAIGDAAMTIAPRATPVPVKKLLRFILFIGRNLAASAYRIVIPNVKKAS